MSERRVRSHWLSSRCCWLEFGHCCSSVADRLPRPVCLAQASRLLARCNCGAHRARLIEMPSPHSGSQLLQIALSSFLFGRLVFPNSTHVLHLTSNERFVRHGLRAYLRQTRADAGMSAIWRNGCGQPSDLPVPIRAKCDPHSDMRQSTVRLMARSSLGSWLPGDLNATNFTAYFGQVDGAFFRVELFEAFARTAATALFETDGFMKAAVAPLEVILPTFTMNRPCTCVTKALTYMDWSYSNPAEKLRITPHVVEDVRSGGAPGVYAVKRVPAEDTDLRDYIRNLGRRSIEHHDRVMASNRSSRSLGAIIQRPWADV